jgi:hypothetical protein
MVVNFSRIPDVSSVPSQPSSGGGVSYFRERPGFPSVTYSSSLPCKPIGLRRNDPTDEEIVHPSMGRFLWSAVILILVAGMVAAYYYQRVSCIQSINPTPFHFEY